MASLQRTMRRNIARNELKTQGYKNINRHSKGRSTEDERGKKMFTERVKSPFAQMWADLQSKKTISKSHRKQSR